MSEENYQNLNNETATDRTPGDTISPDVDASENPHDPEGYGTLDDNVDITEPYNEQKATEIENNL